MPRRPTSTSLERADQRLRRLAESNKIGIAVGNLDGRITAANDAFLSLIGYSNEDLANGTLRWDLITPLEYTAADQQAVEQLKTTGIAVPWQKQFLCKGGQRVSVII